MFDCHYKHDLGQFTHPQHFHLRDAKIACNSTRFGRGHCFNNLQEKEKNLFLAPQWYHILCFLIWECIFRFGSSLRLSGGDFLRHFDARKFHLPPLLSRNLSQNTSFSINFGYDCRSVLKQVLKSYDIFRDMHDSCKQVVGLIYTIQFML